MTQDLSGQPWYIQAAASKLLPIITDAAAKGSKTKTDAPLGMGLQNKALTRHSNGPNSLFIAYPTPPHPLVLIFSLFGFGCKAKVSVHSFLQLFIETKPQQGQIRLQVFDNFLAVITDR